MYTLTTPRVYHGAHTLPGHATRVTPGPGVRKRRSPGLNLEINNEDEAQRGLSGPKGVTVVRDFCAELLPLSA